LPVGINESIVNNKNLQLINTEGFAKSIGDATIKTKQAENIQVSIYSIDGRIVTSKACNSCDNISISPNDVVSGIYLVKVNIQNQSKTFKLIKL
jgi:hypothetical protein